MEERGLETSFTACSRSSKPRMWSTYRRHSIQKKNKIHTLSLAVFILHDGCVLEHSQAATAFGRRLCFRKKCGENSI